jgi:glycosyltransferase involved in cell wall biosynthesis
MVDMANYWAEQGWSVDLITLAGAGDDFFELHRDVQRVPLDLLSDSANVWSALYHNWRRVRRIRSAIRQAAPEVVISFVDQSNVLSLFASSGLKIPVIVAERTDPRHHSVGRAWSLLRRMTYPWSAAVVVQTSSVRIHLCETMALDEVRVIPNAVIAARAAGGKTSGGEQPILCGAGRLSREKGFDRLIAAFGSIHKRFPDWQLVIYGDGPERSRLEDLGNQLAPGRVLLPGWAADLDSSFSQAALFALPSRYEGFPNALLEAMSHGTPAVCFDCQSGPGEIVRHGIDGLLVAPDDVEGMAEALAKLMADRGLREQFGQQAVEVVDRFNVDRFFESWEALIGDVAGSAVRL